MVIDLVLGTEFRCLSFSRSFIKVGVIPETNGFILCNYNYRKFSPKKLLDLPVGILPEISPELDPEISTRFYLKVSRRILPKYYFKHSSWDFVINSSKNSSSIPSISFFYICPGTLWNFSSYSLWDFFSNSSSYFVVSSWDSCEKTSRNSTRGSSSNYTGNFMRYSTGDHTRVASKYSTRDS